MSDQNKQKRRYSCQSWNVAAKVVLTPEVFDYDSDEDFVTACDYQRVAEEDEITENLQTCFEDLSENTQSETLTPGHINSSHHESNTCNETLHNDIRTLDKHFFHICMLFRSDIYDILQ